MKHETIHLFFEQSGTFKDIFNGLGYKAYSYDIENQFNATDYQLDLFNEINKAHNKENSVFDNISPNDLIIAFFPCTYFSVQNELFFNEKSYSLRNYSPKEKEDYINKRKLKRDVFYKVLLRFIEVVNRLKLKLIIENPYHQNYLLSQKEMKEPDVVIMNRREFGDYYKKPTAFWFYGLEPSYFSEYTIVTNNSLKKGVNEVSKGIKRSLMHKDFATNFI